MLPLLVSEISALGGFWDEEQHEDEEQEWGVLVIGLYQISAASQKFPLIWCALAKTTYLYLYLYLEGDKVTKGLMVVALAKVPHLYLYLYLYLEGANITKGVIVVALAKTPPVPPDPQSLCATSSWWN